MAKMRVTGGRSSSSTSRTIKEEYKVVAGPKVDYSQYFMEAPKAPTYYTPTVKTENELLKEANDRYGSLYDTYITNSKNARDYNVGVLKSNIAVLDPIYKERLDLLNENYKSSERKLSNDALSKGMGRSSYLIDTRKENNRKLQKDIASTKAEKDRKVQSLNQEIQGEYLEHESKAALYNAQKNAEIDKMVAEAKKEQNKAMFDAQKYNQELYENYQKLLLNQKKHNFNVQKYINELNTKKVTVTTSTKTSTSTTYKAQQGVDRERVMALWDQMSGGQKIRYVQQNKSLLKAGAPDLFGQYSIEAGLYGINTGLQKLKNLIF